MLNQVVLKQNHFYHHNLMRINYTTYDVRRAQDVINPNTEHRDIMMLSGSSSHPFCYARVIGIFHANIIYTGPGLLDYQPRRLEFLWVRWFELTEWPSESEGCGLALDTLRFVPMMEDDAFSFVDPTDVVRGCHIIPSFATGRLHPDGVAMSCCAQDGTDWKKYHINR